MAPTDSDCRNPEPMHVSNPRHPSILPLLWSSRVFKNKSSWDVWLWLFHVKPDGIQLTKHLVVGLIKACCTAGEWYLTFKNPWRHPHASGTHQIQIYQLPRGCNFNTTHNTQHKPIFWQDKLLQMILSIFILSSRLCWERVAEKGVHTSCFILSSHYLFQARIKEVDRLI